MTTERSTAPHLVFERQGHIAIVTLNRPEKKNALSSEMLVRMHDAWIEVDSNPDIRVLIVTGAGGNFCSGGDVFEIIKPLVEETDTIGLLNFTRMTGELVKAMRAAPQPIIAAIDGVCAGAGAILAMASDIRFGTAGAKIAFLFNRVGLGGCDMGACAILPRIIGQGRAAELLFTGRTLGGEEAERWGFFNRLAAPDKVLGEAAALATGLANGPTFANAMTKRALEMEWSMPVDQAIEAEAVAQALCMKTEDFARAYRAFAGKQKPVFEGN